MRSLDRYAIFIILGCGLLWRPCLSWQPIPCCRILQTDISALPSVFQVKEIFLNDFNTCNHTNVAKFSYVPEGGNVSTVVCGNGFNLMSLLLSVLQRVYDKTHLMGQLAEDINSLRTKYVQAFSVYNSKTEEFELISGKNGTVAPETRVVKRSTRSGPGSRAPAE
ncbi:envelope glycoprotein L [Equid gammaherpesvirus 2]|nr:envelope glycoprotein L [Equid gammaherpesvirus 2]UTM05215.1 envelope glycoprotein L [Equid gammaherpesvirus 2]